MESQADDTMVAFSWPVAEGGYRWVKTAPIGEGGRREATAQWVLTDGQPIGRPYPARRYQPLDHESSLFRTFAETKPTRDEIVKFTTRYGPLGETVQITVPDSADAAIQCVAAGELLSTWTDEIGWMHEMVQVWFALTTNEQHTLRDCIEWESDQAVFYRGIQGSALRRRSRDGKRGGKLIASPRFREELLKLFGSGDVRGPAGALVQSVVNDRLEGRASARMLRQKGKLGLHIVPHNLVAALWLQFARAIDGHKRYRRCESDGCQRYIEISFDQTGYRSDRRYCSNACRSKALRHRIALARQLSRQHLPVKEIARQCQSDSATVNKWLRLSQPRRRK